MSPCLCLISSQGQWSVWWFLLSGFNCRLCTHRPSLFRNLFLSTTPLCHRMTVHFTSTINFYDDIYDLIHFVLVKLKMSLWPLFHSNVGWLVPEIILGFVGVWCWKCHTGRHITWVEILSSALTLVSPHVTQFNSTASKDIWTWLNHAWYTFNLLVSNHK